ncbi:MAG: methyltransferase domain-containing protein [Myxococcales bacterium]|nr:methyltransferase domain-containing protein [Myxococcales bacterium]
MLSLLRKLQVRLAAPADSKPCDVPRGDRVALAEFRARLTAMPSPRVLEVGARRLDGGASSTLRRAWAPHAREYLGTDVQAGLDVDFVADLHELSRTAGIEAFDAIVSCSTFEHLKYPQLAAHEIMKTLKIGGLLYIQRLTRPFRCTHSRSTTFASLARAWPRSSALGWDSRCTARTTTSAPPSGRARRRGSRFIQPS